MDLKRRRQYEGECDHVSKRPQFQEEEKEEGESSGLVLYLVKNKLTTKHYNHLKSLASKNGFSVTETFK